MNEITTVGLDLAKNVLSRCTPSMQRATRFGLHQKAGHMTASDLYAARQIISCQAGAIHT
jgi:hypothetical protein